MKVLIDSCVAKSVGAALATAGHEVESVAQQTVVAVAVFARYGDELARGAIVTADAGRTRVRLRIP